MADDQQVASRGVAPARAVAILVGAYPILWVLGLAGLFWPMAGLACLAAVWRGPLKPAGIAALALAAFIVLSIPIGVMTFGWSFGRVVAAGANCAVWILLAALLSRPSAQSDVTLLRKAFLAVVTAQGALTLASWATYPTELPVPLFQSLTVRLPAGFSAFAQNNLLYQDWLEGAALRSTGMSGNATWSGAIGAAAILLALFGSAPTDSLQSRILAAAATLSGVVSLYFSLSRSTMIGFVVAVSVGVVFAALNRVRVSPLFILPIGAIACLCIVVTFGSELFATASAVNDARAGSLETRSAIYVRSLDLLQDLRIPLLGYGIKPTESGLVANVATHSTYIGVLFRAGILGALALGALLVALCVSAARKRSALAWAVTSFVVIWAIFEDLDTGHLLPIALAVAHMGPARAMGIKLDGDSAISTGTGDRRQRRPTQARTRRIRFPL